MENEMSKSLHIGISLTTSIALIVIAMAMISVCRLGYSNMQIRKAYRISNEAKAEFINYSGELSADEVINFVVTYGTKYVYIFNDYGTLTSSDNITDKVINTLYNRGKINTKEVGAGKFPLVSTSLLDTFENQIVGGNTYKLRAITFEGIEKNITEANVCQVIIIERK